MKFTKLAEVVQPNKPKPTTTLPDNMQWAWDPNVADWVAVLKDNSVTTPPLYDPNNQNVVNQNTTSYMSTVKSASEQESYNYEGYEITVENIMGKWYAVARKGLKQLGTDGYSIKGDALRNIEYQINNDFSKQSSCLAKFLDGPQYSKEIKIEAGLIKEGLLKYAGFDFNRGTKYIITDKGLKELRKASEAEHNEALNEKEKLAYLFGFNTDEVSTLDTTGKVLKQATSKKWTICEADGTELGEVVADSELDAKVKFGMEHPEYADSQSISAKEIKSAKQSSIYVYNINWDDERYKYMDVDNPLPLLPKSETIYESDYPHDFEWEHIEEVPNYIMEDAIEDILYKIHEVQPHSFEYEIKMGNKNINANENLHINDYVKVVMPDNPYWNNFKGKITFIEGNNDFSTVVVENEDGKSNMFDRKNLVKINKNIDAKYEETTERHLDYPNPSETPTTDVILENHTGWVNTAAEKRPYTEEEKRMLPLFRLLNEHVGRKEIQLEEDPQKDGNIVATGQAEVINDLEHEVKELGFHCEPIAEITDNDYIGYDIYSLRIFTK